MLKASLALEIEQIVQSIFATMFHAEMVVAAEPFAPCSHSYAASIQITGEWTGCVVLDLAPETAQGVAAAMFRIATDEVSALDRQEVAAELVNMIGGNLKSLLPGPSFLSLPTVTIGREFDVHVHAAERIEDQGFVTDFGPLRLRLYEKQRDGNPQSRV